MTAINRLAAAVIGVTAGATLLMACSSNSGTSGSSGTSKSSAPASTASAGGAQVSNGGAASVKVEGSDLAGLDPKSVTCVKQGGTIDIGTGAPGPQQAVAVVMTDEATPKVQSVALVVDGNALAVSDTGGMKVGSADVKVDGSTYTISGQAQGADMKNPMAGMISKQFTITVTC